MAEVVIEEILPKNFPNFRLYQIIYLTVVINTKEDFKKLKSPRNIMVKLLSNTKGRKEEKMFKGTKKKKKTQTCSFKKSNNKSDKGLLSSTNGSQMTLE